jgi:hypothetical protein
MDFTEKDGSIWPMQMDTGGFSYGFCPAKATWDPMARETYGILCLSMEMGVLYNDGGIINQPDWYMQLITMFAPIYDKLKFAGKCQMVLGKGNKTPKLPRR